MYLVTTSVNYVMPYLRNIVVVCINFNVNLKLTFLFLRSSIRTADSHTWSSSSCNRFNQLKWSPEALAPMQS